MATMAEMSSSGRESGQMTGMPQEQAGGEDKVQMILEEIKNYLPASLFARLEEAINEEETGESEESMGKNEPAGTSEEAMPEEEEAMPVGKHPGAKTKFAALIAHGRMK